MLKRLSIYLGVQVAYLVFIIVLGAYAMAKPSEAPRSRGLIDQPMTDPVDDITDRLIAGDRDGAVEVLNEYYRHKGIDPSKNRWLDIMRRGGTIPDEMFEPAPQPKVKKR
jgi:hypothetical protein